MRLLVTLEQRFVKDEQGGVYANGIFNYTFFARYLDVFEEVAVFARVCGGGGCEPASYRADGPGVEFIEAPYFVGPVEYLKHRRAAQTAAAAAVSQADAFMLRVPGMMGTLIWKELRKRQLPYGVEVVGDPWEALATCGGNRLLKPLLRVHAYGLMRRQCAKAAVAAYVTERTLQKRYPPGDWSTCYSSVELPAEQVLDEAQLQQRLERLREPFDGKRPFRICHVGSMDALYKAQDTLIEAVAVCRKHGLNVQLDLAGDGRYRPVFEAKAAELGVAPWVNFLGMLSPEAVRQAEDRADLFVLPSLTEGLPRVIIEAMARGLPCLASNVGGSGELLAAEYLFPVRNPQVLSEKIEWLLADYSRLQDAAAVNRLKALEFQSETLRLKRKECYEQLRNTTRNART